MGEAALLQTIKGLEDSVRIARKERDAAKKELAAAAEAAELARLRAENATLRKGAAMRLTVSQGGAISVVGLRRQGLFLFKQEALAILDGADQIRQFIKDNDHRLSQGKDDARFQKAGPRLVERRKVRR